MNVIGMHLIIYGKEINFLIVKKYLEAPGINPGTSCMLSERSTIWTTSPLIRFISSIILDSSVIQFSERIKNKILEAPGIDPGTSRMLSERSTIWATPPLITFLEKLIFISKIRDS